MSRCRQVSARAAPTLVRQSIGRFPPVISDFRHLLDGAGHIPSRKYRPVIDTEDQMPSQWLGLGQLRGQMSPSRPGSLTVRSTVVVPNALLRAVVGSASIVDRPCAATSCPAWRPKHVESDSLSNEGTQSDGSSIESQIAPDPCHAKTIWPTGGFDGYLGRAIGEPTALASQAIFFPLGLMSG